MAERSKTNKASVIIIPIVGILLLSLTVFLVASEQVNGPRVLGLFIAAVLIAVARIFMSWLRSKR